MSDTPTAAYLTAIETLKGSVRDPIDVAAIDAIDLDAICPYAKAGAPADDDGAWTVQELQRWHVESRISLLRRRAAGRRGGGSTADDDA